MDKIKNDERGSIGLACIYAPNISTDKIVMIYAYEYATKRLQIDNWMRLQHDGAVGRQVP